MHYFVTCDDDIVKLFKKNENAIRVKIASLMELIGSTLALALAETRTKGWMALVKELGHSGATKFILLYEPGRGDYTKERKALFKDITIKEIINEMKKTGEH